MTVPWATVTPQLLCSGILAEAVKLVDVDAVRSAAETERIRRRLISIDTELKNLLEVIKQVGKAGLTSVRDEMQRLEAERDALLQESERLQVAGSAGRASTEQLRTTIESLLNLKELLSLATAEEQRTLLTHYVDAIEVHARRGEQRTYAMKLLGGAPIGRASESCSPSASAVLSGEADFREVVRKAPRLGLEPRT